MQRMGDSLGGQILGIGVDLVDIERMRDALTRRSRLEQRLFSDEERAYAARHRDPAPHLAARFGAKEAVMKALGVGIGAFPFRAVEVLRDDEGAPSIALSGRAQILASTCGIERWMLSLTHTHSTAAAFVVAVGVSNRADLDQRPASAF